MNHYNCRDLEVVGVAYKMQSPEEHRTVSQIQYWLNKTDLRIDPNFQNAYKVLKISYLMEFTAEC